MEIALEPDFPTYSGGLGVLAGDTVRAAADRRIPMVVVSLVHRRGYCKQHLDSDGWQEDSETVWAPEAHLQALAPKIIVSVDGRTVLVQAWQYTVVGQSGGTVPVLLLDTDLPENTEWDRTLTHRLYGGDATYRLCQEIVLGIGGIKMLRALGHLDLCRFQMNEGHAALLTLALLEEQANRSGKPLFDQGDVEEVRRGCVFTTHTPVPAGHDRFPMDLAIRVLGRPRLAERQDLFCHEGMLNLTQVALKCSHYVNGVAKRHAEVSRAMFDSPAVDAITNGVHVPTWAAPSLQALFDLELPGWREDGFSLRNALKIHPDRLLEAHRLAKQALFNEVRQRTEEAFDPEVCTLGFARRMATYKRADLLFHDLDRLSQVVERSGALQVVYAGKAHPHDQGGKALIQKTLKAREALRGKVRIVFLEDYDWRLGRLITSGVDVWLNTPQPPMEASGTSGMKAAVNGVPSLSVLDGWWIEGCIEGVTGWSIGRTCRRDGSDEDQRGCDARSLYERLEQEVLPTYYREPLRFADIMRHAIALNGSFFNTQRMILQYVQRAYLC